MKKKILVTGCAGFIGSSITNYLASKNPNKFDIWGIDNFSKGNKENISKKIKFIKGSCESDIILKKLKKKKFFAILHFAGQSSGEVSFNKPLKDFNDNLFTTIKLLEFAIANKCKQFIYASSMGVYGDNKFVKNEKIFPNPKSIYGVSKNASENYIKIYKSKGLNFTILRLFNVYGPGQRLDNLNQGMVRIFFNQIFKNKKLIVKGSKNRVRDFIYIDDVVSIVSKLIGNKKAFNEIFNICSGESHKIDKLIKTIKKIVNFNFKVIYSKETPLDQKYISADNTKIKKVLKLNKFLNLEKGLRFFYNSLKKIN